MYRKSSIVLLVIAAVVAVTVGYFGGKLLLCHVPNDDAISAGEAIAETPKEEEITSTSLPVLEKSSTKPSIPKYSTPELKGGTYSVTVTSSVESEDPLEYRISSSTGKPYVSQNGKFTSVPPSPDNGVYTISVVNTKTREEASTQASGFDKPALQPVTKLSANELTRIFNTGNQPDDMKAKFARHYKMTFTGLDDGETPPDRYEEIFNRLIAAWTSVNVVSVTYDDLNKITSLKINVTY